MTLEDLTRYESAAVAGKYVKDEPELALLGLQDFYTKLTKGTVFEQDPIFQRATAQAFVDARTGIEEYGVLASADLVRAAKKYSNQYENAFNTTKISDLTKYLTDGFKVSDEVKAGLDVYKDATMKDLAEKLKDKALPKEEKEAIERAINAISFLKEGRFRRKGMSFYDNLINENLSALYPKPEKPSA
jgi:hypothetical protein